MNRAAVKLFAACIVRDIATAGPPPPTTDPVTDPYTGKKKKKA